MICVLRADCAIVDSLKQRAESLRGFRISNEFPGMDDTSRIVFATGASVATFRKQTAKDAFEKPAKKAKQPATVVP